MGQPAELDVKVYYVATIVIPTRKNIEDLGIVAGVFKISHEDAMRDLQRWFLDSEHCLVPGRLIAGA